VLAPREREVIAFHEMGHALVALLLPGGDAVHKVSIIPRGIGALGYTLQRPSEDRYVQTRSELQRRVTVLMAGRAAELLRFGEVSTGAADDLARATDLARDMAMRHGMVEVLGHVAYEEPPARFLDLPPGLEGPGARRHGARTQQRIDDAVLSIVSEGFEQARSLLQARAATLERGAAQLLARETLDEPALLALVADLRAPGSGPAAKTVPAAPGA
jgi:cell division protease FtsH